MAVFSRQIATALRLIAKNGQSVTWRSLVDGAPIDPDQPWKPTLATSTDHSVSIVFLPVDRVGMEFLNFVKGTEVPTGSLQGLMGSVNFTPKIKDVVLRGSEQLVIKSVDLISPNGENILFTMVFE